MYVFWFFFLQVRGQCLQQDSVNSTHDRHKVHAFIYDFHPFTAALLKKKLGRQFSFLCIIHGLYVIKSSIQGNLTITSEANKNSVFKFCIVALSRIRLIYYFNSTKNHIFKLSIDSSHMFYFFSHLLDSTWRWC